MTKQETGKIIAVLWQFYPQAIQDDAEGIINAWHMVLADYSYNEVQAAVAAFCANDTKGFAPSVGQIVYWIQRNVSAGLSENEAWAMVSKACANGLYGYKEEFAKLPPEVQAAVGRPEQLKEWAMMDADEVQSVVASNFMRSYRVTQQRAREWNALPKSVQSVLTSITRPMLEGAE